jgi:plastocyanin
MKTRLMLFLVLAVAALGTGAVGASAHGVQASSAKGQTLIVIARDFSFTLSKSTLTAGKVTIIFKNKGQSIHNFDIVKSKSSPFLAPGTSKTFTVTLKKGKYHYLCTVPRHAELGMFGDIVVK